MTEASSSRALACNNGINVNRTISSWGDRLLADLWRLALCRSKSLSQNCSDLCEENCPLTRAAAYNKRRGSVEAHSGIMAKPFVICHEETDERDRSRCTPRLAYIQCIHVYTYTCKCMCCIVGVRFGSIDRASILCLHYCFPFVTSLFHYPSVPFVPKGRCSICNEISASVSGADTR